MFNGSVIWGGKMRNESVFLKLISIHYLSCKIHISRTPGIIKFKK